MLQVFKELNKKRTICLMLLPATLYMVLFSYIPMAGVVMAFKQFDFSLGIFKSPWVGLENFNFLFVSGDAWRITAHTLAFNAIFIISTTILQILFAILLSEVYGKYFVKLTQSVMFVPYFVSWVILGSIAFSFFNYETGTLNGILNYFGIMPIDVLNDESWMKFLLVFFNAWKGVGYGTVIYLASITAMDTEVYEAATIDGCNVFEKIRYITLPHLIPTIMVLTLLSVGRIFRGDLGLFYQLVNSPQLIDSTDIVDTYVFRSLMTSGDLGMAASAGLYQSLLCFLSIVGLNFIVKKIQPDYALF